MEMNEILYKLLYHRTFRTAFMEGKYDGLGISSQQLEDLASIDVDQLNKTSQRIIEQILSKEGSLSLKTAFPRVFSEWRRLFPEDDESFELAYFFLESKAFREVKNLDAGDSRDLLSAFREFLLSKLPETEKYSALRNAI